MAGTKAGAAKATAKLLARDSDFFRKAGAKGGAHRSPNKGFGGMTRAKHEAASRKGGRRSRRRSTNTETQWDKQPSTSIESSTKTPQTEAPLLKSSSTSSNGGDLDRSEQSSRGSKLISRLLGRA